MKISLKIAIFLALVGVASVSFSQTNEITIRFIGNCGLSMTDGTSHIYIDFPYKSGAYNYMEYDVSELDSVKTNPIFIYTHKHADHYSGKLVKKLAKDLGGRIYGPGNIRELLKLNQNLSDFKIEAFKTKHRYSFHHYSYLITWHHKKIYISGDASNAETMAALKDIDWAFVPVWLLTDAKQKGLNLENVSNMFAVYHIGPGEHVTNKSNNPKIKLLIRQGDMIIIKY